MMEIKISCEYEVTDIEWLLLINEIQDLLRESHDGKFSNMKAYIEFEKDE